MTEPEPITWKAVLIFPLVLPLIVWITISHYIRRYRTTRSSDNA